MLVAGNNTSVKIILVGIILKILSIHIIVVLNKNWLSISLESQFYCFLSDDKRIC